eukprot:329817_1
MKVFVQCLLFLVITSTVSFLWTFNSILKEEFLASELSVIVKKPKRKRTSPNVPISHMDIIHRGTNNLIHPDIFPIIPGLVGVNPPIPIIPNRPRLVSANVPKPDKITLSGEEEEEDAEEDIENDKFE